MYTKKKKKNILKLGMYIIFFANNKNRGFKQSGNKLKSFTDIKKIKEE